MKRSKAFNDKISELPQEILGRILYFLPQEVAVRTSVLSKSWRNIWCTRPNLDFSEVAFKGNKQVFLSAVTDSLQRYYDQRLSLEEFYLCISLGDSWEQESVLLLGKWIPTLTNKGMKKFCLSICSGNYRVSVKPPSVIFFGAAESLQDLHLDGFELDRKTIERMVLFKHLKTLRLLRVSFEVDVFHKIISRCPSLEALYVTRCTRLRTINVNDLQNLKNFTFMTGISFLEEPCSIKIHPRSIETIQIYHGGNLSFQKGAEFRDLNDLCLLGVESSSLEHMSSCKFPSLERFTLSYCLGPEEIKLFIDAPKIKHFEYRGIHIPSISFAATTCSEWRSHLNLTYSHPDGGAALWFLKLQELLKSLSQTEITLAIDKYPMNDDENINLVQGINGNCNQPIVVESLGFLCHSSSIVPSLLNALLWICRPRNIGDGPFKDKWETKVVRCLWKILMERESGDKDDQLRRYSWLQDLEEVSMEIKRIDGKEWRPTTLLELPSYDKREYIITTRFALKWRSTNFVSP